MTLKEHIDDIRNQLKQGAFSHEAAVSDGIVRRLLHALNWPIFTPKVFIPEYAVGGQRVDFALCHPPEKARVFIEVKQVGNLDGAEEQLFGYAFREGVPIAILTDGRIWRFFHSTGEGKFRERKVYELDLLESDSAESIKRLNRYLNYEAVRKGDAIIAIKNDYQSVSKQREIEARLPEAWSKLLHDEDGFSDFLIEAMAGKTESLCEARPTTEQILTYLKSLKRETESKIEVIPYTPKQNKVTPTPPNKSRKSIKKPPTRLRVTMPNGEVIDHHGAAQTFVEVIIRLGPEKVLPIKPSVVSTTPFPFGNIQHGQLNIRSHSSTSYKKSLLESIAKQLGIQLKVELTEK